MDKEYFASINTVSKDLGLPAHTLRYWEKQFPTIVRPVAGAGGRRYYRAETVARLRTIQDLLYNRGMTIAGVKKLIHNGDFLVNKIAAPSGADNSRNMPIEKSKPRINGFDNDFICSNEPSAIAPLDTAKIDLAIGLLNQARDLLN